MRILLDECLPRKLKRELLPHTAMTVTEIGWSGIKNGALLRLAETQFDIFLTADRNLPYQQNVSSYNIAVVLVARNNRIDTLRQLAPGVLEALQTIQAGDIIMVGAKL